MSPDREDGSDEIDDVGVFLGLDVGKSAHHRHGTTPAGKKVFDKQLPNGQPKLRAVFDEPATEFGTVALIGDGAGDRETSAAVPRRMGYC